MKRYSLNYSADIVRRKNKFFPRLLLLTVCILMITGAVFAVFYAVNYFNEKKSNSPNSLYPLWEQGDFEAVYNLSKKILATDAFQSTAVTFAGYSAYYLALLQTDSAAAQQYIDDAIINLRVALLTAKKRVKAQISYVLGKAYFQKNTLSSYTYYADSAVKFFNEALDLGASEPDIAEYLGLSYAVLGMTEQSIGAFTEALAIRESDVLLLAIGEQYLKSGKPHIAKQYLFKVITSSTDDFLVLKSRNLLAQQYIAEENYAEAAKEFTTILEKNVNFADAYYGLGVLYEKQGDMVKARAEWRKALRVQVNHPESLKKLGS